VGKRERDRHRGHDLVRIRGRTREELVELHGVHGILPVASGGYFVSEFFGGRISRLWPDGHLTTVAHVVKPGPIAFDARHRILGVTLSGATLFRIERGRARTIYP
jgi:hypothetical protein